MPYVAEHTREITERLSRQKIACGGRPSKPIPVQGGVRFSDCLRGGFVAEELPEGLQRLGDDLSLCQDGHKIRVTTPAGDDMPVKVARQSRPGNPSQVKSHVETVGIHHIFENSEHPIDCLHECGMLGGRDLTKCPDMPAWGNQEMTIVVWVSVQDDNCQFILINHEPLGAFWLGYRLTEKAPGVGSRKKP